MHGPKVEGLPIKEDDRGWTKILCTAGLIAIGVKLGVDIVSENRTELVGDALFTAGGIAATAVLWPRHGDR